MKRSLLVLALGATAIADHPSAPFFPLLDRTADGVIRPEEVEKNPWVTRLDTDQSGGVTVAELAAGWDKYPALRAGLAQRFPEALGYASPPVAPPAKDSPRQGVRHLHAAAHGVGTMIPDASVQALDGTVLALSSVAANRPLVIANFSSSCPVGKRYVPTLLALQRDHAGVAFVFLATNKTDLDAELIQALPGATIVRDPTGGLLRALGAKATTDCFLLDGRRTLRYRGAVDDQYGLGYSLAEPRAHFLRRALAAVVKGETPEVAATEAPGCELDLSHAVALPGATVTFHDRISRILQEHCQECHRQGGVAPFPLETREQVGEHAGMIRKMVSERLMPPWFAAPPAAGEQSPWRNERSLPERDRADLLGWLANGRPAGDEKHAPIPRVWPVGEWTNGTPDAIFQIPQPIAVKATGTMPYQTTQVSTGFTESRYVTGIEILPTAREVVHHVLVFADAPSTPFNIARQGLRRRGELRVANDHDDESSGFFGIYVPGNSVLKYPDGFAKLLPAGATLRFQIHYTPNGKATTDQLRIGLKFASQPPRHEVLTAGISNHRFTIPPGANNHQVEARLPVPREAVVLAFLPHMHVRGKAWRYEAITPGGAPRVLLDVPRYDFNWQLLYQLADPLRLPAGSVLKATAWFDNSSENPANPNPAQAVRWGPQTTDEMMLGYVEYYFPGSPSRRR